MLYFLRFCFPCICSKLPLNSLSFFPLNKGKKKLQPRIKTEGRAPCRIPVMGVGDWPHRRRLDGARGREGGGDDPVLFRRGWQETGGKERRLKRLWDVYEKSGSERVEEAGMKRWRCIHALWPLPGRLGRIRGGQGSCQPQSPSCQIQDRSHSQRPMELAGDGAHLSATHP